MMELTKEMIDRKIETLNQLAKCFVTLAQITSDAYYDQFVNHYATRIPEVTAPAVLSAGGLRIPVVEIPPEEDIKPEKPVSENAQKAKRKNSTKADKKPETAVSKSNDSAVSPTLVEVRSVLAELSRAGFTEQVRGLITGLGYDKLSDVPETRYSELLEQAMEINHAS